MIKNEEFIGICSGYTKEGYGVVKVDHFPFFVKGILYQEKAKLAVLSLKKNYGYARVSTILVSSKERIIPFCKHANVCGGCQIQHMSYLEQCRFKSELVNDCMQRIGKIATPVSPIVPAKQILNYRNKAQIPVGFKDEQIVTGFYRIHSNDIVDMDECAIQSKRINEVLQSLRRILKMYPENACYLRHLLIKHAVDTDQVMVVLISNRKKLVNIDDIIATLCHEIDAIKSIILNINKRNDNVILGDKDLLLYGDEYIEDLFDKYHFRISAHSFYQIHHKQSIALYELALKLSHVSKEQVMLDLYCGIGSISIFFAEHVKEVIGIEINQAAILDAQENARINAISNTSFICSDAQSYAAKCVAEHLHIDLIVMDPPRKGSDVTTITSIAEIAPSTIVYISCDPATCARDLAFFCEIGYEVNKIVPVDMFPHSVHVETVVLMSKKN